MKKAEPKPVLRTLAQVNQEYTDKCANNGQLQYRIKGMQAEIEKNELRMAELCIEGEAAALRERAQAEKEAKKKLYAEQKANGQRPQ